MPAVGHAYWTDDENGLFAQYVERSRTTRGGVVSLWLEIATGSGTTSVNIENSEGVGQTNNCAGANLRPSLQIADSGQPLAVDMSNASAERVSWPLYAGLGALGLIVVAGVAVTRRKTA
jgi:hypothetical protein